MKDRNVRDHIGEPWSPDTRHAGELLAIGSDGRYCEPRGGTKKAEDLDYSGSHWSVDELARIDGETLT